jgi:hypothetical protein
MKTPTSLQEIIDIYAFKYCDRESDGDGYDYTCLDAASPRLLKQVAPPRNFGGRIVVRERQRELTDE